MISIILGFSTISIFTLLAVSFDRYLAVCHALFYRKTVGTKITLFTILICWTTGILGFLPLFGLNSGLFHGKCDARIVLNFDYLIFLCVSASFVPTIILVILYTLIYKKIMNMVRTFFSKNVNFDKNYFDFREKYVQFRQSWIHHLTRKQE